MKKCPSCGKELYEFAQRCDGCGQRGLMSGEVTLTMEKKIIQPLKGQVVSDLPECPKLRGYYCSKDPENCHKHIEAGVCYSCEHAVYKAVYHRKLRAGFKKRGRCPLAK